MIKKFQELMQQNNFDAYIIPTADFHNSEYICEHFKSLAYLSGFTGSAGTLVILQNEAYLWTDGRYHIQAQIELEQTGISLMRHGLPGVPSITEFLDSKLKDNNTLAFDGRVMSTEFVLELKTKLKARLR